MLTESQLQQIIDGFAKNSQLYGAGHLTSKYRRLKRYLEEVTGREIEIGRRVVKVVQPERSFADDADVPF